MRFLPEDYMGIILDKRSEPCRKALELGGLGSTAEGLGFRVQGLGFGV